MVVNLIKRYDTINFTNLIEEKIDWERANE